MDRRGFLTSAAAATGLAGLGWAGWPRAARAADVILRPQPARFKIGSAVTENMFSLSPDAPPPVIWMTQGQRFIADLDNALPEETTLHWHGIRVPAPMDGVPYLAQDPVPAGQSFRYDFTPPDAGSYWYHPHCNTLDQMARGLTGLIVVKETADPGFDADLPVNLRDFRLGSDDQFIEFFKARSASRGGTLGTVVTANWQVGLRQDVPAGGMVRVRLVATDPARIYKIRLAGASAVIVALDGQPVPGGQLPLGPDALLLAPGQRADLAVLMPGVEGAEVVITTDKPGGATDLIRLRAVGISLGRTLGDVPVLPPNPIAQPDLDQADILEFVFGWAPGDTPQPSLCGSLGYSFWSINRKSWPGDFPNPFAPLAEMALGKSYILRLKNETENDHPIHLHGMTFQLLRSDKRALLPLFTDTALLQAHETMDVAVVADNPGDWMFHCHVIEHQKTGLSGYLRVS